METHIHHIGNEQARKLSYQLFNILKDKSHRIGDDQTGNPSYQLFNFEEDNSHLIGDIPIGKLSYQLLKDITNNFSEERKIGSGTFGEVYEGKLKDGRVIAVKMFHYMPEVDDEQFENECERLEWVKHKNLVQLLGFCNEREELLVPYRGKMIRAATIHRALCLEFVPRGSLSRFLSEQYLGLNWQVRFKIIKGICQGLQYLHEVPIMHFDLKPDNIFLDNKMAPKIADFGLSELLCHENTKIIMTPLGIRAYSPPEFLTNQVLSKEYDIFSLGVIIKRIITGVIDNLSIADMDNQECIDHVYNNWRKRLQEIRSYPSLETDCKQVRTCIEIALDCMHTDQSKRPLLKNIVRMLYEVETMEHNPLSQREQSSLCKLEEQLVSIIYYLKRFVAREKGIHDAKVRKMTYEELQDITDDFSDNVGEGGFGTVYRGFLQDGEVVAVKKFDEYSRKSEQQFKRVVNIMALEHKNIVRLIGYCYEKKKIPVPDSKTIGMYIWQDVIQSLLCYEFVQNRGLDRYITDGSRGLRWQTRHAIIRGICQGLHYLHEGCQNAPIIHEGLQPRNVLLDSSMIPKLGDFCSSMADVSRAHVAPESMVTGKITVKSNIYSLGVLILQMVTGEPSSRCHIEDVLKSRTQYSYAASMYPWLEQGFVQQVDSWISIGLKCVEVKPQKRPTIGQIIHFLETESANSEFYHHGEFILSSESSITSWSSPEMGDHEIELGALVSMLNDVRSEPTKLSYSLMKSITNDFSQVVGRGGFGVVYLGVVPNGEVAVKKLSVSEGFSDDLFLDEIKCLKRANHKNVVRFLGYCADSHGELFEFNGRNVIAEVQQRLLCFEFVPKGNLHRYIKEKSHGNDWQIHYQIIKGICHGLQYLHKQHINHLDLKLENILLDARMEPKITDFGLSRCFDEGQSRMFTKNIRGSLGWMAPEIIDNGEMSFKSDIYSLGIIIIKLLTRDINCDFENWHKSLDMDCPQVKCCAGIARECIDFDQHKRPTIDNIIHKLNEMESTIQEEFPVIQ